MAKKETNSRGRIAQSLGIKKPRTGSLIPSVYRPSENSLGSMRAEIGAASLSVYGDPFDLDPFDDRYCSTNNWLYLVFGGLSFNHLCKQTCVDIHV